MEYYKISIGQVALLIRYMDIFLKIRKENIKRVKAITEAALATLGETDTDPVGSIIDILGDILCSPQQEDSKGEEESRLQRRAASIPALCGAWESLRPKRLLVVYKHRQGLSAALTRATFWGSRTQITPLRRCGTGSCFEAAGDTDKGLGLEYDRGQDTLRLDGKIQFSRICDRPETDYKPKTGKKGKRYERLPE